MIEALKPYSSYQESHSLPLDKVPSHWQIRSMGSLTNPRSERNRSDLPLLSVVREKGVILRSRMGDDENHNFIPDDLSNYKAVHQGDLVINKMKAWQGSLGITPQDGIVSPAYYVFDFLHPEKQFAHLLLRSKPYVALFGQESDGVRVGQWDLSIQGMKRIPVLVPPAEECAAIVRFLDHADRRIRRAIRAKRKLIALLNEQKQVIIHQAVTQGLDPDVRLKPSGAEWLGNVPEHWEVLPLRRRWNITDCKHLTVPFVEEGVPLASVREVQSFDLKLENAKRTTLEWYQLLIMGGRAPRRGDIIYCRNVIVGATAYVDTSEPFAMGQDVCLIRSESQSQRFLNYFLHSPAMERQLALLLVGSTFDRINVAEIKALKIVVPPRDEQDEIVGYLDQALKGCARAIEGAHCEISMFLELRTRLISDVVTGKLDVREAAAQLPPEEDTAETIGDAEALTEDEEAPEDAEPEEVEA